MGKKQTYKNFVRSDVIVTYLDLHFRFKIHKTCQSTTLYYCWTRNAI